MNATATLRGLRVLIAEDNFLIGETLRDLLIDLGCVVIGPVPDLAEVMAAIEAGGFDAALLDIHLGDGWCQSNGNGSPVGRNFPNPSLGLAHDRAPFGQSG